MGAELSARSLEALGGLREQTEVVALPPMEAAEVAEATAGDHGAIWESNPTRGLPVIDVRARGSRELIPIVKWARERWGTMKVAVSGDDGATQELVDAIEAEGIGILDGETGGWKTASFWDS
ncbi:hypothetical protein WME91_53460 [Sorangium sp. So ce269]